MKLALGTVQFGLDYGISNTTGRTAKGEVRQILDYAQSNGVKFIDTAPLYGASEEVLGNVLDPEFGLIVTKTPYFSNEKISWQDAANLEETFNHSLKNLKRNNIYGLMVHNADDLLKPGGEHLYETMVKLRDGGRVNKIGVSVYSGKQIESILSDFTIDIIQLPVNIFDQRLVQNGMLRHLKEVGIEIHARSVFLQGLLLMEPSSVPQHVESVRSKIEQLHSFFKELGISAVQAALGYVCCLDEVDRVICGVNTIDQWKELITASHTVVDADHFSKFAIDDLLIINPSYWPA